MAKAIVLNQNPTTVIAAQNVVNIGADTTFHLGPKASAPTLDNAGQALQASAKYFNTTNNIEYVYTGAAWTPVNSIDGAIDANIASPAGNEVLKYNSTSSKWENGAGTDPALESSVALASTVIKQVILGSWTETVLPYSGTWEDVIWVPELGLFIAVASIATAPSTERAMYSSNGWQWTMATTPLPLEYWYTLAWSPSLNIMVTGGYNVMTSANGIDWTLRADTLTGPLGGIVWAEGMSRFVGYVTDGPKRGYYSSNGISWSSSGTDLPTRNWRAVCYSPELNLVVAVSTFTFDIQQVATTSNGVNWTYRNASVIEHWEDVCWSSELGLFVAVARGGVGSERIMSSPDGINWTTRTTPTTNNWTSVNWFSELGIFFVTIDSLGAQYVGIQSTDGINWTFVYGPGKRFNQSAWSPELGIIVAIGALSGTTENDYLVVTKY